MSNSYLGPPSLARKILVAAAAVITLSGTGVILKVVKTTGTAAIQRELVLEAKSSSGAGVNADGLGNFTASGFIASERITNCNTIDSTSTGMLICGTDGGGGGGVNSGGVLQLGDARYVNTSGDTMTGTLNVRATISGSIVATKELRMTATGAAATRGIAIIPSSTTKEIFTTKVTNNSLIFFTAFSGSSPPSTLPTLSARVPGVSFSIQNGDIVAPISVGWILVEPQ